MEDWSRKHLDWLGVCGYPFNCIHLFFYLFIFLIKKMTAKKSNRYLAIDSNVAFKLQLDPDIYNATLAPILGVGNTLLSNQKTVSTTLKGACKDGHATLLKVLVAKGNKDSEITRTIELLCDKDNADTARGELTGKTINLGFNNTPSPWVIIKAR